VTSTQTHLYEYFANPYLICDTCEQRAMGFHDTTRCGCHAGTWNVPCGHAAGVTSICPSWSPVDDCRCFPLPCTTRDMP
jgi:hypothetical protein